MLSLAGITASSLLQQPLLTGDPPQHNDAVSPKLFADLERLSRLADIAYCVAPPSTGLSKPFTCLSHCAEFPNFELITAWNTGPLLSDTAGFVAYDHGEDRNSSKGQIVIAFRGTYSITNAIIDLSTIPQEYAPYPGDDGDDSSDKSLFRGRQQQLTSAPQCVNCTVHVGFHTAWQHTRAKIMPDILQASLLQPEYNLTLVGHSLGGAVAMLAALEFKSRGFDPEVTTFGEPRVGNQALADYVDTCFSLNDTQTPGLRYRRVTHVDDPVPLLPLTEWHFAMHAGEIFISKPDLAPNSTDLHHCSGDADRACIAAQDGTVDPDTPSQHTSWRNLLRILKDEIPDILNEPWGIPSRYKLWQLLFAHRDYFHRIGLCIPGGDPLGGGREELYVEF